MSNRTYFVSPNSFKSIKKIQELWKKDYKNYLFLVIFGITSCIRLVFSIKFHENLFSNINEYKIFDSQRTFKNEFDVHILASYVHIGSQILQAIWIIKAFRAIAHFNIKLILSMLCISILDTIQIYYFVLDSICKFIINSIILILMRNFYHKFFAAKVYFIEF